jgi:hypothetical protein
LTGQMDVLIMVSGEANMSETTTENEKNPNIESARQHMKTAREAMHKSVEAWLPKGYLEHRRAARKEMLLALRSLLDAAIDHIEQKTKQE